MIFLQRCPEGQVYDDKTKTCIDKLSVADCIRKIFFNQWIVVVDYVICTSFMLFVATDKCTKGDGPFSIGVCNSQFGFCFEGNYSVEVKRSIDLILPFVIHFENILYFFFRFASEGKCLSIIRGVA